jgi:hypothetical protein
MKTFSHLWQYLVKFFLKWEMFRNKSVEKIKTHILCSVTFFRQSCPLWVNVENSGGAREATNDVTIWRVRVACWTSKAIRTHTEICNTCFSTATMGSWTQLIVTLYVHYLSLLSKCICFSASDRSYANDSSHSGFRYEYLYLYHKNISWSNFAKRKWRVV